MNKSRWGIFVLLVCISCRTPQRPDVALAAANLEALEESVDMESRTVETDNALRFGATHVRLGEIRLGETRTATVRATNATDEPLVVLDVTTACGCTKVAWSKQPVGPQGTTDLEIAFTAEEEGVFFKKIAVRHSAARHPVSFFIEGVVLP